MDGSTSSSPPVVTASSAPRRATSSLLSRSPEVRSARMKSGRMLHFWAAVLAAALLAVLSPFAHACPSDPRWTAGSADDSYLDDLVDLVVAGASAFAAVIAAPPPPGRPAGVTAEVGSGYTSAAPGGPRPARAPPLPPPPLSCVTRLC